MTIRVPRSFSESIRNKRLVALSVLMIFSFLAAMFYKPEFAYAGYPLIGYILIILSTYKLPLMYRVSQKGIYLTTAIGMLAFPLSVAINFWVAWPFDRITDVQHTHYNNLPALLIRTKFCRRATLLPVERSDADTVAQFLKSTDRGTGANAFS